MLANNVDALFQAGWFGSAPKIGIVGVDSAESRDSVDRGALPALQRHGLKLATEPVYVQPGAGGSGDYSNAALRLRSAGVDRVLFGQGASALLLGQQTQSQGYYPHFAISSRQDPRSLPENLQPRTLQGAAGVGWIPRTGQ